MTSLIVIALLIFLGFTVDSAWAHVSMDPTSFNRYGLIPSSLLRTLLGRVFDTPLLAAGFFNFLKL